MKQITQEHKLADVLHGNYMLIPVVNRCGIRLGFGEKTIGAVCAERGVDPEFLVAVMNAFNAENYSAAKKLGPKHVHMIVQYLKKTHASYRRNQIPAIEASIEVLIQSAVENNPRLALVRKFFRQYKKELFLHLKREETVTFPYIESVYKGFMSGGAGKTKRTGRRKYSMSVYEEEHDNMDEKLNDLKNILIKYITGDFNDTVCGTIVFELFRLEKDLQDHTQIEDHILMPLVKTMEAELTARGKA